MSNVLRQFKKQILKNKMLGARIKVNYLLRKMKVVIEENRELEMKKG